MWTLPLSLEARDRELKYIRRMAELNGYDDCLVDGLNRKHRMRGERKNFTSLKPMNRRERSVITGNNRNTKLAVMPYYKPLTEKLERLLKKEGVHVCYKNKNNLRDMIGQVKVPRRDDEKSGIYRIDCQECDSYYIGQTTRRLQERIKEHTRACNGMAGNSTVAVHCAEMDPEHHKGGHKMVRSVDNLALMDAYESLYIETGENLMNTGAPPITSSLFKLLKRK